MTQRCLQRIGFFLSTFGFMLACSLSVHANESLVSAINKLAINSYETVNAYYNFSANVGDKKLLAKISETTDNVSQALSSITSEGSASEFSGDVGKISENVSKFKELVSTNLSFLQDRGYPDLRLADDLARTNTELANDLASFKEKVLTTLDYTPQKNAELCRDVALIVAHLMTKYSARSTSSASQIFQGSETEVPVEETVGKVDADLKQLIEIAKKSPDMKKLIRSTTTKWKFVRNSFLNYNENNVNYIINLYSQKMIGEMTEAESIFLGQ